SSRRRHTRFSRDWSSDVCSSDLLVPMYFQKQAGIVNGIVSAIGGLGGFFPPILLGILYNVTGHYAIGFMALSEVALASLILVVWMYYHGRMELAKQVIDHTVEGIMVTDVHGKIISVNPAFTTITGFTEEEIVGKTPNILKSGKQSKDFYEDLWSKIETEGFSQGKIWNKRKDGTNYLQWLTISAIKNDYGEFVQYTGMFSDMTKED